MAWKISTLLCAAFVVYIYVQTCDESGNVRKGAVEQFLVDHARLFQERHWYRLLTSGFTNPGGPEQVLGNLLLLCVFGFTLESAFGASRMLFAIGFIGIVKPFIVCLVWEYASRRSPWYMSKIVGLENWLTGTVTGSLTNHPEVTGFSGVIYGLGVCVLAYCAKSAQEGRARGTFATSLFLLLVAKDALFLWDDVNYVGHACGVAAGLLFLSIFGIGMVPVGGWGPGFRAVSQKAVESSITHEGRCAGTAAEQRRQTANQARNVQRNWFNHGSVCIFKARRE